MPFAQINQLPKLPDGDYEIRLPGDFVRFQVYTVTTGQLSGQRILKIQDVGSGRWKGFANISLDDDGSFAGLYTWRSMRERITPTYVSNCDTAIRGFIARVQGEAADHIMIEDCPVLPDQIRRILNPEPVETYPFEVVGAGSYTAEGLSVTEGRYSTRRPVARPTVSTVGRFNISRRTTPLAMSCFDSTVVR